MADEVNKLNARALIVVDLQNDFLPGGNLAVTGGDQVIAPIAKLCVERSRLFSTVVATQDWHPAHHESFAVMHPGRCVGEVIDLHGLPQVLWPEHCVQDSFGARFSHGWPVHLTDAVFKKGADPRVDSYSGFFDNGRRADTGLALWLNERGVDEVYICGLATDYCVKFTALDAISMGFKTNIIVDACRGVNLAAGDSDRALLELQQKGVRLLTTRDLLGGV